MMSKKLSIAVAIAAALVFVALSGCAQKGKERYAQPDPCDTLPSKSLAKHPWLKDGATLQVYYRTYGSNRISEIIEVTQTATGAIAKYRPPTPSEDDGWFKNGVPLTGVELDLELNMKEWRTLITSLYNYGVSEWKKDGYPYYIECCSDDPYYAGWNIKISSEKEVFAESSGGWGDPSPENLSEVGKIMGCLEEKIRNNARNYKGERLSAAYKERFNEPISDFERTLTAVRFKDKGGVKGLPFYTIIRRSLTDTVSATYFGIDDDWEFVESHAYLDMSDWLDFVRALHTLNPCQRVMICRDDMYGNNKLRTLYNYRGGYWNRYDKQVNFQFIGSGSDTYKFGCGKTTLFSINDKHMDTTWHELVKIINGMRAKIK